MTKVAVTVAGSNSPITISLSRSRVEVLAGHRLSITVSYDWNIQ
jgi:hypothetical protein